MTLKRNTLWWPTGQTTKYGSKIARPARSLVRSETMAAWPDIFTGLMLSLWILRGTSIRERTILAREYRNSFCRMETKQNDRVLTNNHAGIDELRIEAAV